MAQQKQQKKISGPSGKENICLQHSICTQSRKPSSLLTTLLNYTHPGLQLTVASFSMNSSGAPRDARPISCENCAKAGSAKSGA